MASSPVLEQMIGAKEAADILRCTAETLTDLAKAGKVPAMKIGRKWIFLPSLLRAWMTGVKPELLKYAETEPAAEDALNVYIVQGGPYFKIGIAHNVKARLSAFVTHCPYKCSVVFSILSRRARDIEYEVHEEMADCCVHGEWFELTKQQLATVIKSIKRKAAILR